MGAADRLAGLPNRLVGDGAAIDDDRIIAGQRTHRLALGEVQPATEGDRPGAHQPNCSRSISPLKTCVADAAHADRLSRQPS